MLAAAGGTKSSYDDKWQVIGVENGKLKVVSANDAGKATMGYTDSNANGSGNFEKAIDSYKKRIITLNNAAKKNTGIPTARSITIEDIEKLTTINKGANYGKEYTYTSGTFVDEKGNTVIATLEDPVTIKNTSYDCWLNMHNLESALGDGGYAIASVCVDCTADRASFDTFSLSTNGHLDHSYVFTSTGGARSAYSYVRAVVYI